MTSDLLQLTTAFSGVQLVVIVYLLMKVQNISDRQKEAAKSSAENGEAISRINSRLSHVMGRLKISTEEE